MEGREGRKTSTRENFARCKLLLPCTQTVPAAVPPPVPAPLPSPEGLWRASSLEDMLM